MCERGLIPQPRKVSIHKVTSLKRRQQTEEHERCTQLLSIGGEYRITYPAAQRRFAPITMPRSA